MQSEVRKVLEREREQWDEYSFYKEIANAERSDAARREEPVQALRQAVAELVAKWGVRYVPIDAANMVRDILAELNAIIATKPDAVEDRQATASGPAHDMTPADERIRAIAAQAVRDAMPDVLETVADAMKYDCGFDDTVDMIYMYAARLRKERGDGHAAAAAAVSDAIGKACEAERREATRH